MKLRPLHDRVIVKRLENETKTGSGIGIPDNAAEKDFLAGLAGSLGLDAELVANIDAAASAAKV